MCDRLAEHARENPLSQAPLVIADSTPLIALSKIGQISLLPEIFGEIMLPKAVYNEVVIAGTDQK